MTCLSEIVEATSQKSVMDFEVIDNIIMGMASMKLGELCDAKNLDRCEAILEIADKEDLEASKLTYLEFCNIIDSFCDKDLEYMSYGILRIIVKDAAKTQYIPKRYLDISIDAMGNYLIDQLITKEKSGNPARGWHMRVKTRVQTNKEVFGNVKIDRYTTLKDVLDAADLYSRKPCEPWKEIHRYKNNSIMAYETFDYILINPFMILFGNL